MNLKKLDFSRIIGIAAGALLLLYAVTLLVTFLVDLPDRVESIKYDPSRQLIAAAIWTISELLFLAGYGSLGGLTLMNGIFRKQVKKGYILSFVAIILGQLINALWNIISYIILYNRYSSFQLGALITEIIGALIGLILTAVLVFWAADGLFGFINYKKPTLPMIVEYIILFIILLLLIFGRNLFYVSELCLLLIGITARRDIEEKPPTVLVGWGGAAAALLIEAVQLVVYVGTDIYERVTDVFLYSDTFFRMALIFGIPALIFTALTPLILGGKHFPVKEE